MRKKKICAILIGLLVFVTGCDRYHPVTNTCYPVCHKYCQQACIAEKSAFRYEFVDIGGISACGCFNRDGELFYTERKCYRSDECHPRKWMTIEVNDMIFTVINDSDEDIYQMEQGI